MEEKNVPQSFDWGAGIPEYTFIIAKISGKCNSFVAFSCRMLYNEISKCDKIVAFFICKANCYEYIRKAII